MARVRICDRCGQIINPPNSAKIVEISNKSMMELCCSCSLWIYKYLAGCDVALEEEKERLKK